MRRHSPFTMANANNSQVCKQKWSRMKSFATNTITTKNYTTNLNPSPGEGRRCHDHN